MASHTAASKSSLRAAAASLVFSLLAGVPTCAEDAGLLQGERVAAKPSAEVHSDRIPPLELNRFTFDDNVLRAGEQPHVAHWIVNFCVPWWDGCKNVARTYTQFGDEWQGKLNGDLLTSEVRFATVDCATDKVLCNEQGVEVYPTVVHYTRGEQISMYEVGGKSMEKFHSWISQALTRVENTTATTSADATDLQTGLSSYLMPGDRATDALLVAVGVAASLRLVFSNPELWQKDLSLIPVTKVVPQNIASSTGPAAPEEWARASVEL